MYFILKGNLEISINNRVVGSLKDGSFFGEVALLAQVPRTATIRAVTSSTLYCLQRSDFEEILKDYEDMAIRIRKVYQERMEMVKNANAKDKENQQQQQQQKQKAKEGSQ
jgi:CRP-like cAMP-binding protein